MRRYMKVSEKQSSKALKHAEQAGSSKPRITPAPATSTHHIITVQNYRETDRQRQRDASACIRRHQASTSALSPITITPHSDPTCIEFDDDSHPMTWRTSFT
jgi:hypothetical protein